MRPGRKLSQQILGAQLAVLVVALLVGFGLFVRAIGQELDHQYEMRALTIANAAADMPQIRAQMAAGDPQHLVAGLASQLRQATHASYIVVIDRNGVRHSHPDPTLIGQKISEPVVALDGREYSGVDQGNLGRSANGRTPLRAPDGTIIGEVSAGILESQISAQVRQDIPSLALYTALALGVGVIASLLLTRRLKRETFGLELHEIADLLQEREAMLHGIQEGVITLNADNRVSLVNDEARRLLDLREHGVGRPVAELVPPGRVRDLICGDTGLGDDELVLTDRHCLTISRMPVSHQGRSLGAVVLLRDRTELVGALRELDSVRTFTDALRAQQHEYSNRMHVVAGLLELGRQDEAAAYLAEITLASDVLADSLRDRLRSPTIVALLLAKVTVATERLVSLTVTEDSRLEDPGKHRQVLVSIIGNLIDNAIDAAAGTPQAWVRVHVRQDANGIHLTVADSGPGVPDSTSVFLDGWTTKGARSGGHRGLGLALVARLVAQAGGTINVTNQQGAVFDVRLPVVAEVREKEAIW